MGGDAGSMLGNVAGRVLGVLSALPSRGGGFSNLANYMARRQEAMSDPNKRAALTPFGAGFYNIGGSMQATPGAPGYYAPVASPKDFMGPMMATPAGPMEYVPGAPGPRVWKADLPALAPEAALQEEAFRRAQVDLQSPDPGARARAKLAAKIPLTAEEAQALTDAARQWQSTQPVGSTASVNVGGTTYTIGSPYALPPGAVQTPSQGEMPLEQLQPQLLPGQVPQATGRTNAAGQPLYQAVTPPAVPKPPKPELTVPPVAQPPAVTPAPPVPPAGPKPELPVPPVATAPGTVAYPSPAFGAEEPMTPAAPPVAVSVVPAAPAPAVQMTPTTGGPPPVAVTPAMGGRPAAVFPAGAKPGTVNLNAPFFRQLEAERGLPAGVMSGLAEQESGGNPNAATDLSSARGLYQITKDTARAWGISANDRYDPVKSAIATADTLAKRAQQVGITRAVGMHYGGPAASFSQKVGPSGLSPAQFAASVLAKSQKYATSPDELGLVAFPSPAFGAEPPAAAAPVAVAPVPVAPAPPPVAVVSAPAPRPALLGGMPPAVAVVAPPRRPSAAVVIGETPAPGPLGETPAPMPVQLGETPVPVSPWAPAPGEVGYAPPAPVEPPRIAVPGPIGGGPSTALPTVSVPAPPTAAPPEVPPAIAAPPEMRVDPKSGLKLETKTVESETEKQTFQAPGTENIEQRMVLRGLGIVTPETASPEDVAAWRAEQQRLNRQKETTSQDVQRLRRGATEGEAKIDMALFGYRDDLRKLLDAFPNPAERASYIGPLRRPLKEAMEPVFSDPRFQQWQTLVGPFGEKLFDRAGAALTEHEIAVLRPLLPTGKETSPAQFEWRLQNFADKLTTTIATRTAWRQLPVEQQTAATYDALEQQIEAQRDAARHQALAPPTKAGESTTTTPTTTKPPGPGTDARGQIPQTFIPERSFASEVPSILGATALPAAVGASPFAPVLAIPGVPTGLATVGGALGEGGRIGYEVVTGTPPAEAGGPVGRMTRAAVRTGTGEAVVGPLVRGAGAVVRNAPALLQAIPYVRRFVPAGAAAQVAQAIPQMAQVAPPWLIEPAGRAARQGVTAVVLPPAPQDPGQLPWRPLEY